MKDNLKSVGIGGAGVRWTPLPQAEAPTEPTGETNCIISTCKKQDRLRSVSCG